MANPHVSKRKSDALRSVLRGAFVAAAWRRGIVASALAAAVLGAGGCSSLIGSVAADTLSAAVLNQDDPALVAEGLPAYLMLVDGLISQSPENPDLLAAGAQLYALYGSRFAPDAERARALTEKGRRYGQGALCLARVRGCHWDMLDYDSFVVELSSVPGSDIDYLYAYAIGWLSHLDATSEDWSAVAELPWVEAALERVLEIDETHERGALHAYLGILNALRPPALGGRPEVARAHFERAIELSAGADLSIKVEYARRYGRMMFDQDLHDRLLREVMAAPAQADGFTLFNTLAKREAADLLATSNEYF